MYSSFGRERQEANKWKTSAIAVTKGNIALVYGDTPRSTWKSERTEELYKRNDGQEGSFRVRTQGRALYHPSTL